MLSWHLYVDLPLICFTLNLIPVWDIYSGMFCNVISVCAFLCIIEGEWILMIQLWHSFSIFLQEEIMQRIRRNPHTVKSVPLSNLTFYHSSCTCEQSNAQARYAQQHTFRAAQQHQRFSFSRPAGGFDIVQLKTMWYEGVTRVCGG